MIRHAGLAILALALPMAAKAAPASDFGVGAAACAKLLASPAHDEKLLAADGWSRSEERGPIRVLARKGVAVRLFVSAMFGSQSCVVDGYADKGDDLKALSAAIAAALGPIAGADLKVAESSQPDGQGFAFGSVMQILSIVRRPGGSSVRVTGMAM